MAECEPAVSMDRKHVTRDIGDSGNEEGVTKRKHRTKDKKICRVCGDKALGYNFNAMTCESCKAFFRRNALKESTQQCLFQNNCSIDVRTRRFCPYCRLKKCLDVGMKREMILDENERKVRMQKVIENRRKRSQEGKVTVKEEPHSDPETVQPDQSGLASSSSNLYFTERLIHPLMSPSKEMDRDSEKKGAFFSAVFNSSAFFEKGKVPIPLPDEVPQDPGMYRVLNEQERIMASQLQISYATTLGEIFWENSELNEDSYHCADDLVNNSELAVRRLIKFIKTVEDFQVLSQEDQIAALKACVLNSLLLRSVVFYKIDRDAWITPTGEIPTSILMKTTANRRLHECHVSYCRTMKTIIQDDMTMFGLLQVIIIFNPDGKDMKNREFISNMQDKYLILLKHYLESKFTYDYGRDYNVILLQKLSDLKGLSEEHAKILLQVNPNQIEPLMLEVLNLK
ncbi:hypothetical protein CHS0354_008487 [Potamilus streckersoni]|uniref:Nuclear hormone receptor HR96 n=1 Tax=Potamilus streckersoni TaxID=2493646 RepID=A0AAE0SEP2_9BIVA|nr:hypothetical protein CHS0354_008487 [Potamilus streckersoni]